MNITWWAFIAICNGFFYVCCINTFMARRQLAFGVINYGLFACYCIIRKQIFFPTISLNEWMQMRWPVFPCYVYRILFFFYMVVVIVLRHLVFGKKYDWKLCFIDVHTQTDNIWFNTTALDCSLFYSHSVNLAQIFAPFLCKIIVFFASLILLVVDLHHIKRIENYEHR